MMGDKPKDRSNQEDDEGRVPEELFFGVIRATGVEEEEVVVALRTQLVDFGYEIVEIRLSAWLHRLDGVADVAATTTKNGQENQLDRLVSLGVAGDYLRQRVGDANALARCAVFEAAVIRRLLLRKEGTPPRKIAYIFRTLMHKAEVGLLRDLYGERFFAIAVHAPEDSRRQHLLNRLQRVGDDQKMSRIISELLLSDKNAANPAAFRELTAVLSDSKGPINKAALQDQIDKRYRRHMSGTYEIADLFVEVGGPKTDDATDRSAKHHIGRLLNLIHGDPYTFPTLDELGMAHAYAAVSGSASLARNVGAAICSSHGDFLTSGYNEVPKPGGGVYGQPARIDDRPEREADARDHEEGGDISDLIRRELFRDLVGRFASELDWIETLSDEMQIAFINSDEGRFTSEEIREHIEAEIPSHERGGKFDRVIDRFLKSEVIRDAEFFNVIEYGRSVHAEMQAVTTAARRGLSIDRATLFVTTFPCHECTRHIIASGIRRVLYVEPYLKSRALQLHPDAISVADELSPTSIWRDGLDPDMVEAGDPGRPGNWPRPEITVRFEPFKGISPRRHSVLFDPPTRKLSRRLLEKHRQDAKAADVASLNYDPARLVQGVIAPWPTRLGEYEIRSSIAGPGRAMSVRLLTVQEDEEIARFRYLVRRMRDTGDDPSVAIRPNKERFKRSRLTEHVLSARLQSGQDAGSAKARRKVLKTISMKLKARDDNRF